MSITITPRNVRPNAKMFDLDHVPITSQVPLFYGAYYKVIAPLEPGSILEASSSYKEFVADQDPTKYCIIYDALYMGMDTRMKLNVHVFNGHGFMENREAAEKEYEMKQEKESNKISKFSITRLDWDKLLASNQLVKLA